MEVTVESYLKRPSTQDMAMTAIAGFMNNVAYANQNPGKPFFIDAAVVFCSGSSARWMTFGTTRVLYFSDGNFVRESAKKEFPRPGVEPMFMPELEPAFQLEKGASAFLECSKSVTDALSVQEIEQTLAGAETSEQWLRRLEEKCAGLGDYSAQCLILPAMKKRLPIWLIPAVIAAAAAAVVVFLLVK